METKKKLKRSLNLKSDRLKMHPFHEQDAEELIALLCDEEIKKTYMIPDFTSREDCINMLDALKEMSYSNEHFGYGIYLKEKLIGFMNDVEIEGDCIELGYVIHPHMKNQGYASEALETAIQELFRMGYSKIRTGFFEENKASERVMKKCAMEKIEKTEDVQYQGHIHHCVYYEIKKCNDEFI